MPEHLITFSFEVTHREPVADGRNLTIRQGVLERALKDALAQYGTATARCIQIQTEVHHHGD